MVDTVMADSSKKQCDKDLGPGHCFHHQRSGSGPHAWKVAPPVVLVPAVDMVISETQEGRYRSHMALSSHRHRPVGGGKEHAPPPRTTPRRQRRRKAPVRQPQRHHRGRSSFRPPARFSMLLRQHFLLLAFCPVERGRGAPDRRTKISHTMTVWLLLGDADRRRARRHRPAPLPAIAPASHVLGQWCQYIVLHRRERSLGARRCCVRGGWKDDPCSRPRRQRPPRRCKGQSGTTCRRQIGCYARLEGTAVGWYGWRGGGWVVAGWIKPGSGGLAAVEPAPTSSDQL
jgi:hypothetical protein